MKFLIILLACATAIGIEIKNPLKGYSVYTTAPGMTLDVDIFAINGDNMEKLLTVTQSGKVRMRGKTVGEDPEIPKIILKAVEHDNLFISKPKENK